MKKKKKFMPQKPEGSYGISQLSEVPKGCPKLLNEMCPVRLGGLLTEAQAYSYLVLVWYQTSQAIVTLGLQEMANTGHLRHVRSSSLTRG